MSGTEWSPEENEAIVVDYLAMLLKSLRREPLNKAAHNRDLRRAFLRGRSEGSVEFKHQNISAVLVTLGYDYLDGYRPAFNVQASLSDVVEAQLGARPELAELIRCVVETPIADSSPKALPMFVQPPPSQRHAQAVREWGQARPRGAFIDFAAIERRNRSLGLAGERMVLDFERQRLWDSDRKELADRVEHVSHTKGDGLGYDLLSFEVDGGERLIEVKTTSLAEMAPFFVTRNEVEVSRARASDYHLYRLYRFVQDPKLFMLKGSLDVTCRLDPTEFRAEVA